MSSDIEKSSPKSKIPKSSTSPPYADPTACSAMNASANASVVATATASGAGTHPTASQSTDAAAPPPVASLPTGQKSYELDVQNFSDWDASAATAAANDRFKSFCESLERSACSHPQPPAFGSIRIRVANSTATVCHDLLAGDGFILGCFVNFGRDEEVINSSRFAVYQVTVRRCHGPIVAFALASSNTLFFAFPPPTFAAEVEIDAGSCSRRWRIRSAPFHSLEGKSYRPALRIY